MSNLEAFKALLKSSGNSVTTARLKVFEALVGQEPLAMHDVAARAREVDRASVYRAVDLFEQLGIVQRLNTGWKYKIELTDKFAEHHHHLTCLRCGRTVAMSEVELEDFIVQLSRAHGFSPVSHQIEIQGYCTGCAAHATPDVTDSSVEA